MEQGEVLGVVESMLGANRVKVRSMDSKTRMGKIPGKMKKRVWLVGDVIIMCLGLFKTTRQTSHGGTKVRKLSG